MTNDVIKNDDGFVIQNKPKQKLEHNVTLWDNLSGAIKKETI